MNFLRSSGGLLGAALFAGALGAQQSSPVPPAFQDGEAQQGGSALHQNAFRRIASFPIFLNTDVDEQSVSEIVAAADGGNLLVYTDSENENLGFVDISDPYNPTPAGVVDLAGEPTSVAVKGRYALACINTSADFVNTSGDLVVVDVDTRQIVATIPLGGQPDAIAVSPNGRFAAIAIENERDEDLGDGEPPQSPPGFVVIVDLVGPPSNWSTRDVDLVGVPDLFPEDPEPEFVDISNSNIAVVTLQENNHIVLIRLSNGRIIHDFPAGTVDLDDIDVDENDLIDQTASLENVPREPDAVAWTSNLTFSTADEGDLFGGSRGFTNWLGGGWTLFEAGNDLEHVVARLGHYPEDRSENKGCEPEGIEYGRYGSKKYLFVGSERSNLVFVYRLLNAPILGNTFPLFVQALPTGIAPEGLLAIPERDLFVVACEEDSRDDKVRATIMIYKRGEAPNYPSIYSADRAGSHLPIPWGALSGLTASSNSLLGGGSETVFAIHDSYYRKSRIFTLDVDSTPAVITDELVLNDANDVLIGALDNLKANLPGTEDFVPADNVNGDGSVNLDAEGIAVDGDGKFWIASEGTGNLEGGVSDPDDQPFARPNMLVRVARNGTIEEVVMPPLSLTRNQLRFGFEGVAAVGDHLYVAFQRAWQDAGDPSDRARIGRYDRNSGQWTFAYYPLDAPTSDAGGWVGLSELTHLGGDEFAVVERDNQGGPDAAIKRVYSFSIAGVNFQADSQVPGFDVLGKALARDLLVTGAYDFTGGLVPEKQEGMTVLQDGTTLIVNDNDGVEDNNGETQLLKLEDLFDN